MFLADKIKKLFSFCNIIAMLTCFVLSATISLPQTPPHPRLKGKISTGEVKLPQRILNGGKLSGDLSMPETGKFIQQNSGNSSLDSKDKNFLVVLVDFRDKEHSVTPEYFDSLLFSSSSLSLKSYFNEISCGKINFSTLNLPSKLGWIRAPESYSFYTSGGNYGLGSYPNNIQKLAEDIIKEINPYVDLSKYDNNKDGIADGIIIVHCGRGAEYSGDTSDIWSYSGTMGYHQGSDQVPLFKYTVCPEYYLDNKGDMTIGTFAHELCHTYFGLNDLYDIDYSSKGLGKWSLMAGGSWNGNSFVGGDVPSYPDAFSRIQMGFASPQLLHGNFKDLRIEQTEDNLTQIYKIWGDGKYSGEEYFLLENRLRKGFDQYLPGEGLLIYHIDQNVSNNFSEWYPGHTSSGHYMISLIQADNKWDLEKNVNSGDEGDPFPGTQNNTDFTFLTNPGSRSYSGKDSRVGVNNIRRSENTIIADVNIFPDSLGRIAIFTPNTAARVIPGGQYTIRWQSVPKSQKVCIEYTYNAGKSWNQIASEVEDSSGTFLWSVPDIYKSFCKIRIYDINYPSVYSESGQFSICDGLVTVNRPEPGDLVFTQVVDGTTEGFELLTLKDIIIGDLKIANVPLKASDSLSRADLILDMAFDLGYYMTIREGNFIRFIKSNGDYDIDSSGRILTFYYGKIKPNSFLSINYAPLTVYRGSSENPVFITGFDLSRSLFGSDDVFFRPNKGNILPQGILGNYWFNEPVSGRKKYVIDALRTVENWSASNTQLGFIDKNITIAKLDVDLSELKGEYYNNSVEIRWKAESEINNQGWQIERKTLNTNWVNLGFSASEGNSTTGRIYSFIDRSITPPEVYYYRLRQISLNNVSNYSHAIKINAAISSSFNLLQNYPNPFNSSTILKFTLPVQSAVKLIIFNVLGQILQETDMGICPAGINKTNLNLESYPSGVYFYTLHASAISSKENFSGTKKMVIIR